MKTLLMVFKSLLPCLLFISTFGFTHNIYNLDFACTALAKVSNSIALQSGKWTKVYSLSEFGGGGCPINAVGAIVPYPGRDWFILFEKGTDRYTYYKADEKAWTDVFSTTQFGKGSLPFNKIDAAYTFYSQGLDKIMLFDAESSKYGAYYEIPTPTFTQQYDFKSAFGGGGAPFSNVGAVVPYPGMNWYILFERNSNQWIIYQEDEKIWSPVFKLSQFGGGGCPFNSIGAAIPYMDGSGKHKLLLFDGSGERYVYYDNDLSGTYTIHNNYGTQFKDAYLSWDYDSELKYPSVTVEKGDRVEWRLEAVSGKPNIYTIHNTYGTQFKDAYLTWDFKPEWHYPRVTVRDSRVEWRLEAAPAPIIKTSARELKEGVHFYKMSNGVWTEITSPPEIKDLINYPKVPDGINGNEYQDWYYVNMDANKEYLFDATSSRFSINLYHYWKYEPAVAEKGITKNYSALRKGKMFKGGFNGNQWIVIRPVLPGNKGAYNFTYTEYPDKVSLTYGEMSLVAGIKVPRLNPDGTYLYLNFDGTNFKTPSKDITLKDNSIVSVRTKSFIPFDASPYLGTSDMPGATDREGLIQHILFKAAEIYSPFSVYVSRIKGLNAHNNDRTNSTIFIGDDRNQRNSYGVAHKTINNLDLGNKRLDLGWVDNVNNEKNKTDALDQIIRGIIHEGGHTFGLMHVRTNGSDIPPLSNGQAQSFQTWAANGFKNPQCLGTWNGPGTRPEAMSYNSTNSIFEDYPFSLTGWNNDLQNNNNNNCGGDLSHYGSFFPRWGNTIIITQNSYKYLKFVLGGGWYKEEASVADLDAIMQYSDRATAYLLAKGYKPEQPGYIDPAFKKHLKGVTDQQIKETIKANPDIVNTKLKLMQQMPYIGNRMRQFSTKIHRLGDYDVYLLKPSDDYQIKDITCSPMASSSLDPILMLYNETGKKLLAYDDNGLGGKASKINYSFENGTTYKLVVGAKDSSTEGRYELNIIK